VTVSACCLIGKPKPTPPQEGCLKSPLPNLLSVQFAGPTEGCPDPFIVCFDKANLAKLESNMAEMQKYATEAWLLCGAESSKK
jgi:hypothetical protein